MGFIEKSYTCVHENLQFEKWEIETILHIHMCKVVCPGAVM